MICSHSSDAPRFSHEISRNFFKQTEEIKKIILDHNHWRIRTRYQARGRLLDTKTIRSHTLVSLSQFCKSGNKSKGPLTPTKCRMHDMNWHRHYSFHVSYTSQDSAAAFYVPLVEFSTRLVCNGFRDNFYQMHLNSSSYFSASAFSCAFAFAFAFAFAITF